MYRGFDDEKAFKKEIDTHLVAFASGECVASAADRNVPIMPDSINAELERHKAEAQRAIGELEKLSAEAKRAREEAERAPLLRTPPPAPKLASA